MTLYRKVRAKSLSLTARLSPEDQQVQSMPDASPTKWHLAHVTWFFETFLLIPAKGSYQPLNPDYAFLFNSYYDAVGARHPRPQRGLLTRPSHSQVLAYRAHVDAALIRLIAEAPAAEWPALQTLLDLGLNHEQQHQELILMDIKHAFFTNPSKPAVFDPGPETPAEDSPLDWIGIVGGLSQIGHDGTGFAFDNEAPRHKVWLEPFRIAGRLVTQGEYLRFINDGGYRRADLWLSDGWTRVQEDAWRAPLYWRETPGGWTVFSLAGERPLAAADPVLHLSYYEADAYARWIDARLPTEAEWEVAASHEDFLQGAGCAWQWTASAYLPYPGFRAAAGAVGEYNGKFMSGQMVLRGGAAVTPDGHCRPSYRNFFPPHARWAFSGLRLAKDAE